MVGPFFFFSAPNSKALQRPKFFILSDEHFSHFILSVIFFVTCPTTSNQTALMRPRRTPTTARTYRFSSSNMQAS